MRITHFSWEFPPTIWGGLGTFALEVTKKQAQLGHHVEVYAINYQNTSKENEKWNDVEVHRPKTIELHDTFLLFANNDVRSWGTHFQFFSDVVNFNITSAYNFYRNSREKTRPTDIIDGHDWLGIIGAMAAKKVISAPLVFHLHSTETGRSLGGGSQTIKHIEYEGGQQADAIITVSHAMKKELIKLGFPNKKIHVCWNGVDPDKYDSNRFSENEIDTLKKKYKIKKDEILLFFVGRLVTVKGVDKLVKAMPSILKDYPKCKLLILGVGDLEELLYSLVDKLEIKDNVIIVPKFVSEEERILHYAASDVVILPSLYEPFGIVCTEAMSMGKPVVVGAKGVNGMAEQIICSGENICGYHINPYDPLDIAWGVKEILKMDDIGEHLGKNGRNRVIKEFTWDVVTKKTLNIYQKL